MQEDMNDVLARAKELIREEIPPLRYNTAIKPMEILSLTQDTVQLKVQTSYQKTKILEPFCADLIKEAFNIVTERELKIEIICVEELALNNKTEDGEESDPTLPIVQSPTSKAANNGVLNPKYTFDSFVIGKSNELAHAAALATAENPGRAYNPLFLYGGVGLGKTHLMQAVGNYVLSQNRAARVLYITGEKFTNELVFSIQSNKNEDFRAKYRNIDLLLVDDIQFISGKERSQEEFFHTFNELYENNKQIVISSDRPPKDLNPLEERLRSRFEWGLITDLSKPDYETRYAILRKKIESDNIIIDEEILSLIANKVESNIRELEGTLNKIVAMASLTNMPITMQLAERALGDLQHSKEKVITVDYIQSVVAKYYNIDKSDFKVQRRSGDIAFPRQIAMFLAKQLTGQPLVEIGKSFGGRDHTTVIYAINKIESIIKTDPNTRTIVDNIRKMIIN
ncbi:MAG: chromosomal replication initiator protein DnaA [Clostridia bacterium]|nr:chromosomal replication initiator protein DnaA [Clostridia bacterium]